MGSLVGFFVVFREHPLIVLAVFLIVIAGVLRWLGGENTRAALAGMRNVAASFFTVPFQFLKRTMLMFEKADELERPYINSHEHVLHIANRFNYLAIAVLAILVLAGGISSSLIALYPEAEIAARQPLRDELDSAKAALDSAQKDLDAAGKPGYADRLKADADRASADSTKRAVAKEKAKSAVEAAGEGLDLGGAVNGVLDATSEENAKSAAANTATQIDAKCESWSGFTADRCLSLKQAFLALGDATGAAVSAERAASEGDRVYRSAGQAQSSAQALVTMNGESVKSAQTAYDEVSIWKMTWLKSHVIVSGGLLVAALGWVIGIVWIGAIIAEVLSWLILMMLSLERKNRAD